jgi:cell division protein ZapA
MTPSVVHVDIQGQHYAVKSELDQAYIIELATFVEERMRRVADEVGGADAVRVAVIAALNIADELFRARATESTLERDVLTRAADIERIVDAVLGGGDTRAMAAHG